METISIYKYLDYRKYLKDYFCTRKKIDPKFSHRYLSRRLGLSSTNFILMVMQGKRNLTLKLVHKISEVFNHDQREAEYFECLVNFNQSDTLNEKNRFFKRIMEMCRRTDLWKIEESQYEYYSNWYNLVIRELVTSPDFRDNFKWLAKKILPNITESQAKKSVKLLINLGLINKNSNGYNQSYPLISTGPQVSSLAVANFHRTMAQLAAEAISKISKEKRDMTSCTISLSKEGFERVKDAIAECRKKIMEIAGKDISTDIMYKVYQINFHLFPISEEYKNNKIKE
ncbi:MAG: TIGR02147 family protein [Chitinispirillaceae bacterium]|nr:TIGR02147 family protein [Chitinispirillaceae bacterium]